MDSSATPLSFPCPKLFRSSCFQTGSHHEPTPTPEINQKICHVIYFTLRRTDTFIWTEKLYLTVYIQGKRVCEATAVPSAFDVFHGPLSKGFQIFLLLICFRTNQIRALGVTHPMRVVRGRTEGDPSVRAAGNARAASEWENPVWTSLLPGITLNEFAINSSIYITASKSVSIPSASFLVFFPDQRTRLITLDLWNRPPLHVYFLIAVKCGRCGRYFRGGAFQSAHHVSGRD